MFLTIFFLACSHERCLHLEIGSQPHCHRRAGRIFLESCQRFSWPQTTHFDLHCMRPVEGNSRELFILI